DVEGRLVGADRVDLVRRDSLGELVAEGEALALAAVGELVEPRLASEDGAAELRLEAVAVPVMVAVREHDPLGLPARAEPLDSLRRQQRIDQGRGRLDVVGADLGPDVGMHRLPVVDAGANLVQGRLPSSQSVAEGLKPRNWLVP